MDFDCDCCRIDMTLKILGVPTGLPHGTHPNMHSTTNARSIEMVDLKFKFKFSEEMYLSQVYLVGSFPPLFPLPHPIHF